MAASRRFYQSHADNYDQLVFFTDTTVMTDAFAFQSMVKNAITGTGLDAFDFASELGSGGSLQSVINMDRISKYPDAPAAKLFGESSTLGILAHETGHRWLARLEFLDVNRTVSDQLLGRQRAHWSFFTDSDGSVMEGNEIEDLGGGVFRTASATEKYSRLDLYAMGLATEAEVPRWFYIDAPISSRDRESAPRVGQHHQRHPPRRVDPGRDRRARPAPARGSRLATPAPPGIHICQARQRRARSAGSDAARPHPRAVRSVLQSRHRKPDDAADNADTVIIVQSRKPRTKAAVGRDNH